MKKTTLLIASAGILALSSFSSAQSRTFTIVGGNLEYRNLATVESNTEFETFTGRTSKVSGTVNFDPRTRTGSGSISVDVASIDTALPLRNEHMRSPQWLDAGKFPAINFRVTSVRSLGNDRYNVTGAFSMKGVTKTITVPATVRYRPASDATKAAGFDGNVIQIASTFKVKLSDYNVSIPAPARGKVANEVTISISAYGVAK